MVESREIAMPVSEGSSLNQINQLHFDRALIGMNGGKDEGYYNSDMERDVGDAILENAKTNL